MKLTLFIFSLFIGLIFSVGCKTVKTTDGTTLRVRSANFLTKKLDQQKLEVEWMSAKVKVKFSQNGSTNRATADLRLRRDSVIWISVRKFGIEGARALITTDSIYLLNRLERVYEVRDFSFIEQAFNLPASFATLQDMILGNAFYVTTENTTTDIRDDAYYLEAQNADPFLNAYWIEGNTFNLAKAFYNDRRNQRQLILQQSNYQPVGKAPAFAYQRDIVAQSPDLGTIEVELELSKVTFDEAVTMPFSVPSSYRK